MIRKRQNRGIILVLVLWMVVILALIAYTMLYQVSVETSMTIARKNELKAESLARAGIAKAVIDLKNDLLYEKSERDADPQAEPYDAEGDIWARHEESAGLDHLDEEWEITLTSDRDAEENEYFTVRVTDEERYFNINAIKAQNRDLLSTIIEHIGYSEEDAELTAAAIVDWADSDLRVSMEDPPADEETIAYAVIYGEDTGGEDDPDEVEPVVFRNEDFLTVEEMMEVYGVTPDLFFGPGTEEAIYYNRLLQRENQPQNERFQMEDRRRRRDEPILGLRDYFTVYGNRRLNINTAPEHVLDMFAEASEAGEEGWGEEVLEVRRGGKQDDFDNDDVFKSQQDIQAQAEVAGVVAAGARLHGVGVRSTVFRIVSVGHVGDVQARIEALATREMLEIRREEDYEHPERAEEFLERTEERRERRVDDETDQGLEVVNYPHVHIFQMVKD